MNHIANPEVFYKAVCLGMLCSLLFGVFSTWALVVYLRWLNRQWQKERDLKHNVANDLNALRLTLAYHGINPDTLTVP